MIRILAVAAALLVIGAVPAQAFWPRGQVSMCADATTERERIRHRCHELGAYADPGWPALGIKGAGPWGARGKGFAPQHAPITRPPVRRLG
ncbi:MAG: hypothetical protein Q8S58_06665 [Bosea sp. (in: a-proteobacteria)]|uniref:hypothetical protein n=1 Tax=Bosea sp. (in: a-proteobacteria) TaxID=1871050 RepID=UPI002733E531|nr:hypothetical protein [Bosea sp. (in: a-proteobacteria)]MDP3255673.1 hypothetical protein [Bosea sp. (in: a-proteobacteria)]MDP3318795.1 hypothetical protein [Bosea sp. (in: a-proteobacteria)]